MKSSKTRTKTQPKVMLTMGLGEVIVGHAIHDGMPCVTLTPAPKAGAPGQDATDAIPSDDFHPDAVCIRFATPQSTLNMLDRLRMMVENFEAATRI